MRFVCFLFALVLPLLPAGALAAELDEVTLEVIDARASSVGDVMRNIEIPQYDRKAGQESEPRLLTSAVQTDGGTTEPSVHSSHETDAHGDARDDDAESHEESRHGAEESHDDAVEEAHEEAAGEIEDAHDEAASDHEDSHEDTTEEIEDVEKPESPEVPED